MLYLYVKAIHIIFVVTWFAGLFYMVRLFIYNREADDRPLAEREILQTQFKIMMTRLWFGITWPSCVLTIIFGAWLWIMLDSFPLWLMIKIAFVIGLLLYHFTVHIIYTQQQQGIFRYRSQQLRIWNEVATLFLVAIVMTVVVKSAMSWLWGTVGLAALGILLMLAIRFYKKLRE